MWQESLDLKLRYIHTYFEKQAGIARITGILKLLLFFIVSIIFPLYQSRKNSILLFQLQFFKVNFDYF